MRRVALLVVVLAGVGSTSALAQMSGNIELTMARLGEQWKGEAKITATGQPLLGAVREIKVNKNDIKFKTDLLEAELHFSGRLTGDSLSGTIEGFQRGARIATGTWSLARQGSRLDTEPFTGNWVGTFILKGSAQPAAPPRAPDLDFNANVAHPAYANRHPRVFFDAAHNNADTSSGRYRPFADLITSDGYNVVPNKETLSKRALTGYNVLVVVNASGPADHRDASPFTQEECEAVRDWVRSGGALLLITDQAPFSAALSQLSYQFGVDLTKGYTTDPSKYNKESEDQTELVFSRDDGLVGEHAITQGRNAAERINRVITFTGTSLKGPAGSVAFLKLADTAMDVFPSDRKPSPTGEGAPDPEKVTAAGRAQGIALEFGKGRVVVLGEAAMLTAQVALRGFRFGMNVPGIDNRQLALNIMHWLSGLLK